jgi:septal ring-binding cell division protein DamX
LEAATVAELGVLEVPWQGEEIEMAAENRHGPVDEPVQHSEAEKVAGSKLETVAEPAAEPVQYWKVEKVAGNKPESVAESRQH